MKKIHLATHHPDMPAMCNKNYIGIRLKDPEDFEILMHNASASPSLCKNCKEYFRTIFKQKHK